MAATKFFINKSHNRAVVKVVATTSGDSATINITTEMLFGAQSALNPKVGISGIFYSVSSSGSVSITRNGKLLYKLFGHDSLQMGTQEENGSDIVVSFDGTAGGTLVLELSKTSGFSDVIES